MMLAIHLCYWVLAFLMLASTTVHAKGLRHLIELDISVNETSGIIHFEIAREDQLGPAMEVYRRVQGAIGPSSWVWKARLPREVTQWSDTSPMPGLIYEYQFFVPTDGDFPDETAAYVSCGIRAPLVDQRGKVLLVVDETLAPLLSVELERFMLDLVGDGWQVERLHFGRNGSATPESLRAAIQSRHASAPLSSIILFGHLPVVYSGLIDPDKHDLYPQATDLFYADVDGVWQDVLATNFPDRQNFYAADGKYDHASVPGPNHRIEIPIGRIDMANMPAWPLSEVELLRRYLNKNHHFRQCRHVIPREGYFTSLAYDESPFEAAAASAMLGPERTIEAYDNGEMEQSRPFLWGFAGRDWNGANYPNYRFKSHFAINFASGKQAWESDNNQMRAMLAMPWYGLTCSWGVRPNWLFHFAGMGQTIGYCNYRTVNNNNNASTATALDYLPGDDFNEEFDGFVHVNLMGDPTLRIHPVSPVRNLFATSSSAGPLLTWEAGDDFRVIGFHVYRAASAHGPYTRLTQAPLEALSFQDLNPLATQAWYMVRPIKIEVVPVGSYVNAGQGSFVRIQGSTANRAPIPQDWSYTIAMNASLTFNATMADPDGDLVKHFAAAPPLFGEVTGSGPTFVYEPKPNFTGLDRFPITAWDGLAESVGMVTIQVGPASPAAGLSYQAWQAGVNWQGRDSSMAGDANGDGLINLLEYQLARNPLGPPSPWYSSAQVDQAGPRGQAWWIEYRRRKNFPSVIMQCQNNGLPSWNTLVPDGRDVVMEVFPDYFPGEPDAELVRMRILMREDFRSRLFRLETND